MTFQSLLLVPNNSVIIHDTLYKVHIVYYTMHFHTTLCNFPNYLTISIVWRFPVKWDWSIYEAADPSAKCVPCTVYTSCEFIICVYNTVAEPFFSSFHSSHLLPWVEGTGEGGDQDNWLCDSNKNCQSGKPSKKRVKLVTLSLKVGWVGTQKHISDRKEIVT